MKTSSFLSLHPELWDDMEKLSDHFSVTENRYCIVLTHEITRVTVLILRRGPTSYNCLAATCDGDRKLRVPLGSGSISDCFPRVIQHLMELGY